MLYVIRGWECLSVGFWVIKCNGNWRHGGHFVKGEWVGFGILYLLSRRPILIEKTESLKRSVSFCLSCIMFLMIGIGLLDIADLIMLLIVFIWSIWCLGTPTFYRVL